MDSKAKVKSENNRSLRKMKKNRSIVRQMLFPTANHNSGASSSATAAAAAVASAPSAAAAARPRGNGGGKKAALDEANVNGDQGGISEFGIWIA